MTDATERAFREGYDEALRVSSAVNGGAAFPHQFERTPNHPRFAESEGMSLRDWFAGQAIVGLAITWASSHGEDQAGDDAIIAAAAYRLADAMLKARR